MTNTKKTNIYEIWLKWNDGRIMGGNKLKTVKNAKKYIKDLDGIMSRVNITPVAWKIINIETNEIVETYGEAF
jgi:hypothetical protein